MMTKINCLNDCLEMLADDLSDLSEDDDNLYPDGENEEAEGLKLIQLELKPTTNPELKPTTNPKIKQLFSDTDKVNVSVDEYMSIDSFY